MRISEELGERELSNDECFLMVLDDAVLVDTEGS
jgi:hypothetical protein